MPEQQALSVSHPYVSSQPSPARPAPQQVPPTQVLLSQSPLLVQDSPASSPVAVQTPWRQCPEQHSSQALQGWPTRCLLGAQHCRPSQDWLQHSLLAMHAWPRSLPPAAQHQLTAPSASTGEHCPVEQSLFAEQVSPSFNCDAWQVPLMQKVPSPQS